MLKFSKKWVKLQGHKVKNVGTHGKILSQRIFVWNIKAIELMFEKLLARLKFKTELKKKTICPRSSILCDQNSEDDWKF